MSRGVNKVFLIGNLGNDPVERNSKSGVLVCNASMATSRTYKTSTGEREERTDWHQLVFWNKLAEIAAKYLRKGTKVYVEGRLQTNKWKNQDGEPRENVQVVVQELEILTPKGDVSDDYTKPESDGNRDKPQSSAPDYSDDDIPF